MATSFTSFSRVEQNFLSNLKPFHLPQWFVALSLPGCCWSGCWVPPWTRLACSPVTRDRHLYPACWGESSATPSWNQKRVAILVISGEHSEHVCFTLISFSLYNLHCNVKRSKTNNDVFLLTLPPKIRVGWLIIPVHYFFLFYVISWKHSFWSNVHFLPFHKTSSKLFNGQQICSPHTVVLCSI